MTIAIGDKIPSVKLKEKTADGAADIDSADFAKDRTVVIFAVPGAFTPTCSLNHLPGFLDKRDEILAKGVDEIAVVSVNDHFVMGTWAKSSGGEGKIRFFADGNGDFAKAVGLDIDLSGGGLGLRSKRYSMLVKDGVVTQLNVEATPGTADTSGAETLLGQL
jgi:peroxiredoxin